MEEASWRRHHGGGIMASRDIWETAERQLGGIWEASGRHLGTSGRHLEAGVALGVIWEGLEASGRSGAEKVEHLTAKIDVCWKHINFTFSL